ncbi:MAG: MerR family transcriptional regulator [Nitriliruptoraceae bacterium]
MTIGELATRSGVPVKTIRFYDEEQLLSGVERSPAGYRLFDPSHLRRLRLIRAMRSLDLPLAEVRVLVEVAFVEDCGRFEARLAEQVDRRRSDVDRAIEELTELRSTLEALAQRLDRAASPCHDADGCPADECTSCHIIDDWEDTSP